jgi:hypothetical protein
MIVVLFFLACADAPIEGTGAEGDADTDADADSDSDTETGKLYGKGWFVVSPQVSADLDEGDTHWLVDERGDFVWFAIDEIRVIDPKNGAALLPMGTGEVGYGQCDDARTTTDDIDASGFSNMSVDVWICAHTSEGRVSAFAVHVAQEEVDKLIVDYTTWE